MENASGTTFSVSGAYRTFLGEKLPIISDCFCLSGDFKR